MNEKVSAGVILYRETPDERQYLLLKSRTGDWEFPKGGVEEDEELQQTAIRETSEEAGIDDLRLIDGFSDSYDYVFRDRDGNMTHKEVFMFIGEAVDDDVDLSVEHNDLQWRNYEQAKNTLPHSGPKRILDAAHTYLDEVLAQA